MIDYFHYSCIVGNQYHQIMTIARITNLEYIKEITDNDPEIMKEFIQLFLEQIPEFKDGMNACLQVQKWKELGMIAHKAKASVMTFGMNTIGHRLNELQQKTAELDDVDSFPMYVEEFLNALSLAENELEKDIKSLQ